MSPDRVGLELLASVIPIATGSVDRLDQVASRLAFLFEYEPDRTLAPESRDEIRSAGARSVVRALATRLKSEPRLDRERFRAVASQIRAETGQKGKALFHPIRIVLTGRAEGPELDAAVPAIDRGAELPPSAGIPKIVGCRERAADFSRTLEAPA